MDNPKNDMQDAKEQILTEVESYAKAEYAVVRYRAIDKISRVVGSFLLTICLILVAFAVLSFCAVAAVFVLAQYVPAWAACLIIGAIYLMLIPVLIACSKVLFVNPIIRMLSGLKNSEDLRYETARAEGMAAVQRERMNGHLLFAKAVVNHCSNMIQMAWKTIRSIFSKKAGR